MEEVTFSEGIMNFESNSGGSFSMQLFWYWSFWGRYIFSPLKKSCIIGVHGSGCPRKNLEKVLKNDAFGDDPASFLGQQSYFQGRTLWHRERKSTRKSRTV